MPEIRIIAALSDNRVIGNAGGIPWNIPEDLKRFRELTRGGVLIFGRKTYESIGRLLPGRTNIIISRSDISLPEGGILAHSLSEAICIARTLSVPHITIGGGSTIYTEWLGFADVLYLTHVPWNYEGDAFFPEIGNEWSEISREKRTECEYVEYRRI